MENISNIQAYCTPNGNSQRINLLALADSALDLEKKRINLFCYQG